MSSPLLVLERAVLLHEALDAADIPHALGGALALAYHVQDARGTNDIDLNVTCDPDRPQPLFAALPADLPWTEADIDSVRRTGQVRLYWPHPDGPPRSPVPVDLFLPQDEFHAVVAARTELVPMLHTTVPVISATDLAVFKALFSRTKDWADIEELLRFGHADAEEVGRWLVELVGADDERLARLAAAVQAAGAPHVQIVAADLFGRGTRRLGD
ncbi:MAG: nucleotidyl transferase AbiEii/AbiGii toxin family protein [Mycobacteriales bacterium]